MARRTFFSFEYEEDITRVMVVRNSNALKESKLATDFIDAVLLEKKKTKTNSEIIMWINKQLMETSVTVVLAGKNTCASEWVKYEIRQSINRGNGLLCIDISQIKDLQGNTSKMCEEMSDEVPRNCPFYSWCDDDGYNNMGNWIEKAATAAGK